jgi:hypothetical protein
MKLILSQQTRNPKYWTIISISPGGHKTSLRSGMTRSQAFSFVAMLANIVQGK